MRNQSSQPLGGPVTISPLASPTQQFARRGKGASAAGSPGQRVLHDFSGLSNTAQKYFDEKQKEKDSQLTDIGTQIGEMREEGKSDEQIFKEISESGETPRRTASRLAKLYNKQDGFSRAESPVFRLALQGVRGEARAKAVRRQAEDPALLSAATRRVAAGKPEEREALIAKELEKLRKDTTDLLNPDELGYFGIRVAEEHLTQTNDQLASKLSAGASALQLGEAQKEVRTAFLEESQLVIDAFRNPDGNPYTAMEEFAKNVGVIGENAKFSGILSEDELREYLLGAGGEVYLSVGAKEAADFLTYAVDNVRNGNGVAFNKGDLSVQRVIDNYRFKIGKEASDRAFAAARKREADGQLLVNSSIGLKLAAAVTDDSPGNLLELAENAKKIVLGGNKELFEDEFGLAYDENTRGNIIGWIDKRVVDLSRKQETYSELEMRVVEGNVFDQAVEDPEGAKRTLAATDLSALQRLSFEAKLKAFMDNGVSDVYSKTMTRGMKQAIQTAVLDTVVKNPETGEPVNIREYQSRVDEELAQVRDSFVSDPDMVERLKGNAIEMDKQIKAWGDSARDKWGIMRSMDLGENGLTSSSDKDTIGPKKEGETDRELEKRRKAFDDIYLNRGNYRSGASIIGGYEPGTQPKDVDRIQKIATEALGTTTATRTVLRTRREDQLAGSIFRFIARAKDLPEEETWRVASEALAVSGTLSSTDLYLTGGQIFKKLTKQEGSFASELNKPGFDNDLPLDLEDFNILSARLTDTKNAHKWVAKTNVGLKLTAEMPEDMRKKLEVLLATYGVNPTPYNITEFLASQASEWGNPIK